MAIVAFFKSKLTHDQYDQILAGLEAKGLGSPDGRLNHLAWKSKKGWRVMDVWESNEKLEEFAKVLMPLMDDLGVKVPPPKVFPAHNVI